jgi:class 3 adenylate cyclase
VLQLRGDEALAVFDSASQAVLAGLEFKDALREATSDDPELPMPVGIGIDCGEAVPVEDGYRGAAHQPRGPPLFQGADRRKAR